MSQFNNDNTTEKDSNKCEVNNFLTQKLECSKNNLMDIIGWLKLGAYVVIHSEFARFFHICDGKTMTETEIKEYINSHRFIYVNVSSLPGLLDDGEWNWYINEYAKPVSECKCSLKQVTAVPKEFPYKDLLSI